MKNVELQTLSFEKNEIEIECFRLNINIIEEVNNNNISLDENMKKINLVLI